jgi:hypothetical protein
MKIRTILIASASLIAVGGVASADDHLFEALQHGLTQDSQGFISGDHAPGQGSPFTGEETKTPATDTAAANLHANVKQRTPN